MQVNFCRTAYKHEVHISFLYQAPPKQRGIILSDNDATHFQSARLSLTHMLTVRLASQLLTGASHLRTVVRISYEKYAEYGRQRVAS
jgi:hypothetical protein